MAKLEIKTLRFCVSQMYLPIIYLMKVLKMLQINSYLLYKHQNQLMSSSRLIKI